MGSDFMCPCLIIPPCVTIADAIAATKIVIEASRWAGDFEPEAGTSCPRRLS